MKQIDLFTSEGKFVSNVLIGKEQPDIVVFEDKLYTFNLKHSQYREGTFIVACREEDQHLCHVPAFGPKDKCLRCGISVDPLAGQRYCPEHQIGICAEHNEVDCVHCGYNKQNLNKQKKAKTRATSN